MEENFSHMLEMAMAIVLFVFALTFAVISYNRINSYTDTFFSINSENRRGRASDDRLDLKSNTETDTDIQRKVDYGEIVMTIMNLPKNIVRDGEGNMSYHRIMINKGDKVYFVCYDPRDNGGIYILNGPVADFSNPSATGKGPFSEEKGNLAELELYLTRQGIIQTGAEYTISYNKDANSSGAAANVIIYTSK